MVCTRSRDYNGSSHSKYSRHSAHYELYDDRESNSFSDYDSDTSSSPSRPTPTPMAKTTWKQQLPKNRRRGCASTYSHGSQEEMSNYDYDSNDIDKVSPSRLVVPYNDQDNTHFYNGDIQIQDEPELYNSYKHSDDYSFQYPLNHRIHRRSIYDDDHLSSRALIRQPPPVNSRHKGGLLFIRVIYDIWGGFMEAINNFSDNVIEIISSTRLNVKLLTLFVFILLTTFIWLNGDIDAEDVSNHHHLQYDISHPSGAEAYESSISSKIWSLLSSNKESTIQHILDVQRHMSPEITEKKVEEMLHKFVPSIVSNVLRDKMINVQLPDTDKLNEFVTKVAHRIFMEYVKSDILNIPDFALGSGGSRIIHSYTSRNYVEMPESIAGKFWARMTGRGMIVGLSPSVAVTSDNSVGKCFSFAGDKGQLAIQLSRSIYITSVTYQHIDRALALDDDNLRSAPARLAILGIPDEKYMQNATKARVTEIKSDESETGTRDSDGTTTTSSTKKSQKRVTQDDFIKLGEFVYDLEGPPVQNFVVDHSNGSENIPIKGVIFKINSNWGHGKYTCLYQFKVHGKNINNVMPVSSPQSFQITGNGGGNVALWRCEFNWNFQRNKSFSFVRGL
ncbi:17847_t:CDS:2 [Acaulospora morrowiae]|uniref:17847_t:CDS:1 n=1 Tax=Acaulospora morrowiae TaxID=94023 RepID=A0A9N8V8P8_9GLOM|nr:17847_t:CDS:2 [Acaulospora morrowiae]